MGRKNGGTDTRHPLSLGRLFRSQKASLVTQSPQSVSPRRASRWPWAALPFQVVRGISRRTRLATWEAVVAHLGIDEGVRLVLPWWHTPWLVDASLEATGWDPSARPRSRPVLHWQAGWHGVAALCGARASGRLWNEPIVLQSLGPGDEIEHASRVVEALRRSGRHRAMILLDEVPVEFVQRCAAHIASRRLVTGIGGRTLGRGLFGHRRLPPSVRLELFEAERVATASEAQQMAPTQVPPLVGRSWVHTGWEEILVELVTAFEPGDSAVRSLCKALLLHRDPTARELGLRLLALSGAAPAEEPSALAI